MTILTSLATPYFNPPTIPATCVPCPAQELPPASTVHSEMAFEKGSVIDVTVLEKGCPDGRSTLRRIIALLELIVFHVNPLPFRTRIHCPLVPSFDITCFVKDVNVDALSCRSVAVDAIALVISIVQSTEIERRFALRIECPYIDIQILL